jgi:hypothetical protein
VAGWGPFVLDVVDGVMSCAQGHHAFTDLIAGGRVTWSLRNRLKETELLVGIVAELLAEAWQGAGRVAEAAGDLLGRTTFDETGGEGFVVSVQAVFGGVEEVGDRRAAIASRWAQS